MLSHSTKHNTNAGDDDDDQMRRDEMKVSPSIVKSSHMDAHSRKNVEGHSTSVTATEYLTALDCCSFGGPVFIEAEELLDIKQLGDLCCSIVVKSALSCFLLKEGNKKFRFVTSTTKDGDGDERIWNAENVYLCFHSSTMAWNFLNRFVFVGLDFPLFLPSL